MESPLVLPRLRLTRNSPKMTVERGEIPDFALAGPSRVSPNGMDLLEVNEEEEDTQSTPRISNAARLASEKSSPVHAPPSPLSADNPSARLRAALARVPNPSAISYNHAPAPSYPSDVDSDFEPPNGSQVTRSIARESLHELFSRALRDPGDTPQKPRLRRNSIDGSEVEASPRVERERVKHKGKRKSMSDEEAEKLSRSTNGSEASFRSSAAAATFNALRHRLEQSNLKLPTPPRDRQEHDMDLDSSQDTAILLRDLDASVGTPPAATSTPMRSLQLPSQLQMQSNLLEQDSEMHRVIKGMDSYEGDTVPTEQRFAFPPTRLPTRRPSSPARPVSWTSHSKSHSAHNLPLRRTSGESDASSSRASSSLSGPDYQDRQPEMNKERVHERERGLSQPTHNMPTQRGTPDRSSHHHSNSSPSYPGSGPAGHASPAHGRPRRGSAASLRSIDDGRSSRASSMSSRSDYRERLREYDDEKNKERERQWNRPQSTLSRSSSSLSHHSPSERMRAISQPSRYDPDQHSHSLTPERHAVHRHGSFSSFSGSSRASSPAGSAAGRDAVKNTKPEVVHERERNWGSPRPHWSNQPSKRTARRSQSPLPQSPPAPHSPVDIRKLNGTSVHTPSKPSRSLQQSERMGQASSPRDKDDGAPKINDMGHLRPMSPSMRPDSGSKIPRPASPLPRVKVGLTEEASNNGTFKSRFGWQFPRKGAALPPLELESDSPESRSPSRTSLSARGSHIPVRAGAPAVAENTLSIATADDHQPTKRGHRRSITELNEAAGPIPPRVDVSDAPFDISLESIPHEGPASESDQDAAPVTSTPTLKPATLPLFEPPDFPPISDLPLAPIIAKGDGNPPQTPAKPISPPRSPPPDQSQFFSLQTPPRRPLLNASKIEFQTPSPPRNMPELPGPPSSSEDEVDDEPTPINGNGDMNLLANLTAMKTPKPPGAWATTPVPPERDIPPRPSSVPPETSDAAPDNTFATPQPSGLNRANSLPSRTPPANPLRTPAPPGAWVMTPGSSVRRKSILKVRFDVEASNASSDNFPEVPMVEPAETARPASATTSQPPAAAPPLERTPSPPLPPPRAPKSPSIRVLDAFGRETKLEEPAPTPAEGLDAIRASEQRASEQLTPRSKSAANKSAVRIVDAMGREVAEVSPASAEAAGDDRDDLDLPMSHNEALARVRETIAHLADDLDEVDRSYEDLSQDNRLTALDDASHAARNARKRITQSLQLVKNAEDDIRMKYGQMRKSMNKTKYLPQIVTNAGYTWNFLNTWVLWTFLIAQIFLLIFMYRLSVIRAKELFLSTYYDAFYPDLFIHITKPDTIRRSIPFSYSWSIFSVPDTVTRTGWRGVVTELWGNMTCLVSDWQRQVWDASGYQTHTTLWPPT